MFPSVLSAGRIGVVFLVLLVMMMMLFCCLIVDYDYYYRTCVGMVLSLLYGTVARFVYVFGLEFNFVRACVVDGRYQYE